MGLCIVQRNGRKKRPLQDDERERVAAAKVVKHKKEKDET